VTGLKLMRSRVCMAGARRQRTPRPHRGVARLHREGRQNRRLGPGLGTPPLTPIAPSRPSRPHAHRAPPARGQRALRARRGASDGAISLDRLVTNAMMACKETNDGWEIGQANGDRRRDVRLSTAERTRRELDRACRGPVVPRMSAGETIVRPTTELVDRCLGSDS
jgi:hypothetical protein